MSIQAVLFDLGGVILRTDYQAPREHLAERLGLSYEELAHLVFESESAQRACLGHLTAQQHWEVVCARLRQPVSEAAHLRDEFFAGDVLDFQLLDLIRSLRPARRTALVSNAWLDLREYIRKNRFEDAFDTVVISAEVGLVKPDHAIYELALGQLGVSPGRAVMVDDATANVAGAIDLGMRGILFRDTAHAVQDLDALLA